MSETLQIWLFGILGAWLSGLTVLFYTLSLSVTRIQAVMLLLSKNAAKVLHSPDDHLGLDDLVEKYCKNHHDLSDDEWRQLESRCSEVLEDVMANKTERLAAGQLLAIVRPLSRLGKELSIHKLERTLKP